MSEQKAEPSVSLLQQMKDQHRQFCIQRDQTQANLQQLVGAIYACEIMIQKHESMEKEAAEKAQADAADKPKEADENQGAIDDGQVDSEQEEQVA